MIFKTINNKNDYDTVVRRINFILDIQVPNEDVLKELDHLKVLVEEYNKKHKTTYQNLLKIDKILEDTNKKHNVNNNVETSKPSSEILNS